MSIVILVLSLGGIIAMIYGIWSKLKARRVGGVAVAKTGGASSGQGADAKGTIAVEGKVACGQPLMSPVTGTPCLYYKVLVEEKYMEKGEDKKRTLQEIKNAASFTVDDGSGAVNIDAAKGGDFEPLQVKSDTKSPGLVGGLTGKDLMFGNYALAASVVKMASKYTVREEVLPVTENLYVLGKVNQGVIGAPGFRSMLLTNKSRADVLSTATRQAKLCLIGGAASFVLGFVLNIATKDHNEDIRPQPAHVTNRAP